MNKYSFVLFVIVIILYIGFTPTIVNALVGNICTGAKIKELENNVTTKGITTNVKVNEWIPGSKISVEVDAGNSLIRNIIIWAETVDGEQPGMHVGYWSPISDHAYVDGCDGFPNSTMTNRVDLELPKMAYDWNPPRVGDSKSPTPPVTTQPGPTPPVTTQPGATQPVTTQPGPTPPGATQPGPTPPGATQPDPTQPDATQPDPTQPDATQPDPTQPDATQPDPTQPDATQPGPTQSSPNAPVETTPAQYSDVTTSFSTEVTTTYGVPGPAPTKGKKKKHKCHKRHKCHGKEKHHEKKKHHKKKKHHSKEEDYSQLTSIIKLFERQEGGVVNQNPVGSIVFKGVIQLMDRPDTEIYSFQSNIIQKSTKIPVTTIDNSVPTNPPHSAANANRLNSFIFICLLTLITSILTC